MQPTTSMGYTQTVVTAPLFENEDPFDLKVMAPFIREIFSERVIDEPTLRQDLTSADSFFTGNSLIDFAALDRYIEFGQKVIVPVYKDQNPLSLSQRTDLSYDEIDACHEQLDLSCTMPCLNTLPAIERLEVVFNHEYAYGVRACDKNKRFWDYGLFTRQYAKSRAGYMFKRELDLWNTIVSGIAAAPATNPDIATSAAHPTYFWQNLGTVAADGRKAVMSAYQSFTNSYDVNPTVFIDYLFANNIIESVETPFTMNLSQRTVDTFKEWFIPGYDPADQVAAIMGLPAGKVVILRRSPWMSGDSFNLYPLWSEDRSKQYVAILDPRVGYNYAIDGYHLTIEPYDCDKLIAGMIGSEYVAMGITFPQYGMLLEFDSSIAPETPITELAFAEEAISLNEGASVVTTVTVTPEDATAPITYTSSDTSVAQAYGAGSSVTIIAGKEGEATITAKAGEVEATATVTVTAET